MFVKTSSIFAPPRESDMGSQKWLTAVSKNQCEILRQKEGVFLRSDKSETNPKFIFN